MAAFLFIFMLAAPGQVLAAPLSANVQTLEDTYSDVVYPNNNYGSSSELWTSASSGYYRYIYIKPNLSGYNGKLIVGGILYWYAYSTGASGGCSGGIVPVSSNWSEYGLTYNNSPTYNWSVGVWNLGLAAPAWTDAWFSADIGPIARYWNTNQYGLMMSSGYLWARINSRETGAGPYFTIYYYNQPGSVSYSNVTQTGATVSWGSNGNPGDAVYSLYRNGALVYKGSSTLYCDAGLSPATSYTYTVYASYDADSATYFSAPSTTTLMTAPPTPAEPTGSVTGLNWSSTAGRGRVVLNWSPVATATGYKVWVFDGNAYRGFDVANTTAWDSSVARIYPDPNWLAAQADNSIGADPFNHSGGGFDLQDNPNALYRKTIGTGYDSAANYWFRISAYNAYGESPYGPAYTPTLPNRTDNQGPSGSVTVLSSEGMEKTYNRNVTVHVTAQDSLSGARGIQLSNDGVAWGPEQSPAPVQVNWILSPGAGTKTVYMKIWDSAGNSTVVSGSIALAEDSQTPAVTLTINEGAESTTSNQVSLTITVSDNADLPQQTMMSFSNDGSQWSDWEAYSATKNWNITAGSGGVNNPGIKKVYARILDQAQNVGRATAEIGYNPNPPVITAAVANSVSGTYRGQPVKYVASDLLDLSLADLNGNKVRYDTGMGAWSDWQTFGGSQSILLPKSSGICKVRIQVKDSYGIPVQPVDLTVVIDNEAPVISSLRTVSGAEATTGNTIRAKVDVSDNLSMSFQYSTDGTSYQALPGSGEILLPVLSPGANTITVYIKDEAGNVANKSISIRKL